MADTPRQERAIVLADWPQPAGGAPKPRVLADDTSLSLQYLTVDRLIVVVRFPLCCYFMFGAPNDEALSGHPLYNRGLEFYSVHEVQNSSLIDLLEHRNSLHPSHDRTFLRDKKHYIFTFQDSTLECVATEGEYWRPSNRVFTNAEEADRCWRIAEND